MAKKNQITVKLVIETDNVEATQRAVEKYLKESVEKDFLEPNEKIVSLTIK